MINIIGKSLLTQTCDYLIGIHFYFLFHSFKKKKSPFESRPAPSFLSLSSDLSLAPPPPLSAL